jgi:formate-dependent nitrite reductase membrane component NrfD
MKAPEQAQTPSTQRSEALLPRLRSGKAGPSGSDRASPTTYYGQPMINEPTWKWFIPAYFWVGGVAGGAALVGAVADLLGGDRHRSTVRHARYLTLVLVLICPILLIIDLGRPTRFHHMLRVIKVTSPLSIGTWILSLFGLTSGLLATKQLAEDIAPIQPAIEATVRDERVQTGSRLLRIARALPGKPLSALHGLLGLGLGSYTGILLAATAVPLWAAAGILLGPLFLATAVASGAAALVLLGSIFGWKSATARRQVETVETIGTVAQLGLMIAHEILLPRKISKPLRRGLWGGLYHFGAIGSGVIAPLAIRLAARLSGRTDDRALATAASALSFTGALVERFAITEAGKRSAADPIAYQELTKGAPGEARPTPSQQAQQAPRVSPYREHFVAPEVTG